MSGLCAAVNNNLLRIVRVIATGMVHIEITLLHFFAVCFHLSVCGFYLFCINHARWCKVYIYIYIYIRQRHQYVSLEKNWNQY